MQLKTKVNNLTAQTSTNVEKRVRELVGLFQATRPELSESVVNRMVSTSIAYAKDLLRGKSAELYGLSLDYAIATLRDPKIDRREKNMLVLKVLGHMLPTEVTVTAGEESKPIMFNMSRPGQNEASS